TIRKAVVNLMRTRMRLGLFEEHTEFDDIPYDVVACDVHRKVSLECAEKSMVLLKNEGMLPLKKESLKSIAVIGPNSDSIDALRGNYYGTSIAPKTFLEGIRDEVSGTDIRVYYAEGASLSKDRIQPLAFAEDGIAEALILAEMSDAVVLCVGLDATLEGEQGDTGNAFDSGDKRDLLLPEGQRVLIEKVLALGKPTVVVLAAGSSINPLAGKADALIQAWYPGELGGTALANILFGKVSPSGKLPLTFYQSIEGIPDFADYSMKDRTYRYTRKNILYPFGYGLTYSKVVVTDCVYDDSTAKASVTVQNQGDVDTEDVVQLYIHNTTSANATPFPKLCGFKRVAIPAGGEIVVELTIEDSAFDVVNDEGEVIREGNTFDLFAGVSQPDELSRELTGSSCVRVSVVK
ncbi:MAG: glycoside hydrolase family 3 C-terminal domain-containing protein, partial [Clostridiales bacterium]|nr:glycoside hydrolase family 3 C-terminal domain-containing protein [Clostridiales bacterium]